MTIVIREVFGFPSAADAEAKLNTKVIFDGGSGKVFKLGGGWAYRWYPDGLDLGEPALNAAERPAPTLIDDDPPPVPGSGDPLRALLDFIAKYESGGNYDAYYAHARNTSDPKLTAMTIADVRKFQERYVAEGSASSAAGRYQIIRKTLDSLVASLNISARRTNFDRVSQDSMAMALLHGRGLKRFQAGGMSVEWFAHELAKEWASMPVLEATQGSVRRVTVGQSYYAGDGLNRAHARPENFRAVIEAIAT